MIIIISGTVGVGKSTVSKLLNNELIKKKINSKLFFELQDENPYLDFYYQSRYNWSFLIQLDFLFDRFKNYYKSTLISENRYFIFDRSFIDDYVFFNLNSISETFNEYQKISYKSINQSLVKKIDKKPDYFFLLKTDFDEILNRIKKRGREFEQEEELNDYWKDLYYQYYKNEKVLNYIKKNVKNLIIIDATESEEIIVKKIIQIIKKNN